jgi:DNA polymerase-3 subunit gamma/tau
MNYQVIARKWRPQTFADVVGQEHVTRTLQNAIRTNRVAHAYIFSGVRGVGKTTTARILAKALNCEKGPAPEPCNECDRCREISSGSSLDVMEIDAASNRGIDQIRELREMVRYAPATGRYKVVILDEAHQLTEEASNALLKTLEEPPERVIFILATTSPEDLPETIRSRAQHFHFRSLSFNEIAGAIERVTAAEGLEIEPGAVAVIARAAEGSLRDGLSLLEQAIAYCDRSISDREVRELLGVVSEEMLDELVEAVASGSTERALALVQQVVASGENLDSFCREAIRHVRNLLIARVAGADSPMVAASADERPRLEAQAARFSEEDLTRFFQILLSTQYDLRRQPDPRIHMEMGLLRLVNAAKLVPLEELVAELRGEAGMPRATGSTPAAAPAATPSRTPPSAAGSPRRRFSAEAEPSPYAATDAAQPEGRATVAPASAGGPSASAAHPHAPAQPEDHATSQPAAGRDAPSDHAPVGAGPLSQFGTQKARLKPGPTHSPQAPAPETAADDGALGEVETVGMEPQQVRAVRALVAAQQKFLDSLLENVTRWEISGAELHLYFPAEQRSLAEMLQAREPMEKLRTLANQALGKSFRVCVKLSGSRAGRAQAAKSPAGISGSEAGGDRDLRVEFERNPAVRAVLDRFGGRISGIKPAGGS